MKSPQTSWQPVAKWYSDSVSEKGHYYHQHIVLPGVLRLLGIQSGDSLIDLGCGQGILSRAIKTAIDYTGVDIAEDLIEDAQKYDSNKNHSYLVADCTKAITVTKKDFTHAAFVLSLQNMEKQDQALLTAQKHLREGGVLVIVLNHPAFRIPRQSSWGIDEQNKLQYRRINRYLSPLAIPITMHPGEKSSRVTWSFHQPISYYTNVLHQFGFCIEKLEEWTSDKMSKGQAAKMENRGRNEFPLFLAIRARKQR